ncbi:hypothetical protein OGAPHI_006905 [Ogataea philodendri]|uniref:Uncharacterized protein n=1 Tax=Ogataea philodendri TaxID=1378263 RepID=A0A9P8SZP4_9ASCO|nr:uncharacterized protein OGAPHI_006905 [Ogataea philodendri]KAH3660319.1 hypothetical protein OGAPHI_006905 [Ogataea philodendri]
MSSSSPRCPIYEGDQLLLSSRDIYEQLCDRRIHELSNHIQEIRLILIVGVSAVVCTVSVIFIRSWYLKNPVTKHLFSQNFITLYQKLTWSLIDTKKHIVGLLKSYSQEKELTYYNDSVIDQYYDDEDLLLSYYTEEVSGDLIKHDLEPLSALTDSLFDSAQTMSVPTEVDEVPIDPEDDLRVIVEKPVLNKLHAYIFDQSDFKAASYSATQTYLLKEPIELEEYISVCYGDYTEEEESEEEVDFSDLKPNFDVLTLDYHLSESESRKYEDINVLRKLMSLEDIGEAIHSKVVVHSSFICYLIQTTPDAQFKRLMFNFVRDLITYETDNTLEMDQFAQLVNCLFDATRATTDKYEYCCGIKTLYSTLGAIAIDDFSDCFDYWFFKNTPSLEVEFEVLKLILLKNVSKLASSSTLFEATSQKIKPLLLELPQDPKVIEMKQVWDFVTCFVGNENIVQAKTLLEKPIENKRKISATLEPNASQTKKFKGLRSSNRNDLEY